MGTLSGLQRFDGKQFQTEPLRSPQLLEPVASLYQDPDGTLWIGSGIGGLYRRSGGRVEVAAAPGRLSSVIRSLTSDHDGNLWIGAGGGGLIRWRKGEVSALASGLLADGDVRSLMEDHEGSLWVGQLRSRPVGACATPSSSPPGSPRACRGT